MVKISGHMVAVVVVDHNQGLMKKTKNGIFGYQESEGKFTFMSNFLCIYYLMIFKVQCSKSSNKKPKNWQNPFFF